MPTKNLVNWPAAALKVQGMFFSKNSEKIVGTAFSQKQKPHRLNHLGCKTDGEGKMCKFKMVKNRTKKWKFFSFFKIFFFPFSYY
jgi:hypothetical protein